MSSPAEPKDSSKAVNEVFRFNKRIRFKSRGLGELMKFVRKTIVAVALLVAADSQPTLANACSVTKQGYLSLQTGDSYSTVVRKLGCEGEEMSRTEMAGFVTVMYMWTGGLMANMNAMFQNNELVSKAQFGL